MICYYLINISVFLYLAILKFIVFLIFFLFDNSILIFMIIYFLPFKLNLKCLFNLLI